MNGQRPPRFLRKNVGHRCLKPGAEIAPILHGNPTLLCHKCVPSPQQRRLQPGKGQVAPRPIQQGPWKGEPARISQRRLSLHHRPTRLREAQQLCRLVEGFSRRVIDRSTQTVEPIHAPHDQELAMPSRHQ